MTCRSISYDLVTTEFDRLSGETWQFLRQFSVLQVRGQRQGWSTTHKLSCVFAKPYFNPCQRSFAAFNLVCPLTYYWPFSFSRQWTVCLTLCTPLQIPAEMHSCFSCYLDDRADSMTAVHVNRSCSPNANMFARFDHNTLLRHSEDCQICGSRLCKHYHYFWIICDAPG